MTKDEQKNMTYLIIMGLHEQAAIQFGKIDMKVDNTWLNTWFNNHGLVTWKTLPGTTSVWLAVNYDRK